MARRIRFIEQSEHSECGITSLAMILNYLGIHVSLNTLRDIYGVPKGGNTPFQLQTIFSDYGVESAGLRIKDIDFFKENNRPCILFWDNRHYVVFQKKTLRHIIVVDPALGRKKYTIEEFKQHFSNVALVIKSVSSKQRKRYVDKKRRNGLVELIKTQKLKIMTLICLTLLIQFFALGIPIITQRAVDNYKLLSSDLSPFEIIFSVFTVFLIYYLLQVSRTLIVALFQKYFQKDLMTRFMKKIMVLPLNFFVNRSTGDMIFRSNLSTYIQQLLSSQLVTTVIDVVFVIAYFSLMLSYSKKLTLVCMMGIFVIILSSFINTKKYQSFTDKELALHSKVHRTLVELFEGMETVKSVGAEQQFYDQWETNFNEQLKIQMDKNKVTGFIGGIATSSQFILPLLIIGIGIYGISAGTLTIGELISFNAVASAFVTPIITIMSSFSSILLLKSYFGKLSEILEQKVLVNEEKEEFNEEYKNIELKNVNFQYSKFEKMVLKDINLKIGKNEKVAIVGPSGSGKSTLIKLIAGLYSPTNGEILINGKNMENIKQTSIRSKISVVNQNPTIFNMSLKDNILMNKEGVSDERFRKAVADAKVDEIIESLPMGYMTQISEGGMNLSGGQMQRIAIARAIVKNPELIIMDEPTSALDNISENYIMNRIKEYEFPCVVVSHRLNTIQHFDRIIVMFQGRIVEDGSHEELMKKKGLYSYIYSGNIEVGEIEGGLAVG